MCVSSSKKNIFNVTLADVSLERFEQFKKQFDIHQFSTENDLISFDLKNDSDQHLLLNELMKVGKIRSFDEKIPSMNEVFINAVSGNQAEILI